MAIISLPNQKFVALKFDALLFVLSLIMSSLQASKLFRLKFNGLMMILHLFGGFFVHDFVSVRNAVASLNFDSSDSNSKSFHLI